MIHVCFALIRDIRGHSLLFFSGDIYDKWNKIYAHINWREHCKRSLEDNENKSFIFNPFNYNGFDRGVLMVVWSMKKYINKDILIAMVALCVIISAIVYNCL